MNYEKSNQYTENGNLLGNKFVLIVTKPNKGLHLYKPTSCVSRLLATEQRPSFYQQEFFSNTITASKENQSIVSYLVPPLVNVQSTKR